MILDAALLTAHLGLGWTVKGALPADVHANVLQLTGVLRYCSNHRHPSCPGMLTLGAMPHAPQYAGCSLQAVPSHSLLVLAVLGVLVIVLLVIVLVILVR
jgi:hypothetical protein